MQLNDLKKFSFIWSIKYLKHLPAHTYISRYLILFANFHSVPGYTKGTQLSTSNLTLIVNATDLT